MSLCTVKMEMFMRFHFSLIFVKLIHHEFNVYSKLLEMHEYPLVDSSSH